MYSDMYFPEKEFYKSSPWLEQGLREQIHLFHNVTIRVVRITGKGIFQESWNGNWPIAQWGEAKALRTCLLPSWALLLEEVAPTYSQNYLHLPLLTQVRGKLLSIGEECDNSRHRWVEQEAEGRSERKQKGFLWWVTAFWETISEATTSPAPVQGLYFVLKKKMWQMKHRTTSESSQATYMAEIWEKARPGQAHVTICTSPTSLSKQRDCGWAEDVQFKSPFSLNGANIILFFPLIVTDWIFS